MKPKIKKYSNGGRKPIVVNDPNDPKLRAYNDSNLLHDLTMEQMKVEGINSSFGDLKPSNFSKDISSLDGKTKMIRSSFDGIKDVKPNFKSYLKSQLDLISKRDSIIKTNPDFGYVGSSTNSPDLGHKNIQPTASYYGRGGNYYYKKPVQPVVYQPNQPINNTKNNIPAFDSLSQKEKLNRRKGDFYYPESTGDPVHKDPSYVAITDGVFKKKNVKSTIQPQVKVDTSNAISLFDTASKEQPTITQESISNEKSNFYQGREFMETTGLRPNYYTQSQIEQGKQNIMKNGKRAFRKGGVVSQHNIPQYENGSTIGGVLGASIGSLGFFAGPAVGLATTQLGMKYGQQIGGQYDTPVIDQQPVQQRYYSTIKGLGNNTQLYPDGGLIKAYYDTIKGPGIQGRYGNKGPYIAADVNSKGYAIEGGGNDPITGLGMGVGYSNWKGQSQPYISGKFGLGIGNENASVTPQIKGRLGYKNDQFVKAGVNTYLGGKKFGFDGELGYELLSKQPYGNVGLRYSFADGGTTNANAEVELNEVMRTPNGQTMIANAPSHSQGGMQLNLPPGTEITSDRLINPISGNTFAKDQGALERSKGKAKRSLKLRPNDMYSKNSMKILDDASDNVFHMQEEIKDQEQQSQMYRNGGMIQYADGGEFDPWNQPQEYQMQKQHNMSPLVTQQGRAELSDLGGSNIYTPNTVSQSNMNPNTTQNSQPYNFDKTMSNVGLGVEALNTGIQFANSFNQEPIERIRNNQMDPAIANYQDAINRQRKLKYNVNDQLAANRNSELTTNAYIDHNISNSGVRMGNRLANRSLSLNNTNSIYGDANRANLGIQSQANQMQVGLSGLRGELGGQDAQYQQDYRNMNLQQRAAMRRIRSEASAHSSNYLQQMGRDNQLTSLLPLMYPNSFYNKK